MSIRAHSTTNPVGASASILSSIDSELVGQYESGFYHPIDLWELVKRSLFITTPEEGGEPVTDEAILDAIRDLSNQLRRIQRSAIQSIIDELQA